MSGKLKEQAKKQLKNYWPASVAAVIAVCICAILAVSISEISFYVGELIGTEMAQDICAYASLALLVISVLLIMPLWLGFKRYCYIIAKNGKAEFSDMFRFVTDKKRYSKALTVGFGSMWRLLAFFALFCIPAVVLAASISSIPALSDNETAVVVTQICLFIALVLAILISKRYVLAHYVFFENEELSANLCYSNARNIYRSQRHSLIVLTLSFFPWYLLMFFVLPVLYFMPYISVTVGNFAKWSIYNYLKADPINTQISGTEY